jgi:hypothetical protein
MFGLIVVKSLPPQGTCSLGQLGWDYQIPSLQSNLVEYSKSPSLPWATNLVRAMFNPFLHKEAAQGLLLFFFIHLVHGKGLKLWTLGLKGEIVSIASLFFFPLKTLCKQDILNDNYCLGTIIFLKCKNFLLGIVLQLC